MLTDQANYCALPLASYACRPDLSAGRFHGEPESRVRTAFQRDRDRIIHCSAFRRLKYKTQVFIYHEGDHYRTRLSHTLEVAQIARTLARALFVNEDLAETIALAHDLGHTPFAHSGEDILAEKMHPYQGFEHNDQSLRVLIELEHKYPDWRGLNLTWETLEGVVKHNGPVTGELPYTLALFNPKFDLRLDTFASVEAQVAALADDIAYNNHDVEDGLRAGLFTLEELRSLPLLDQTFSEVETRWPNLPRKLLIQTAIREMIGEMVIDVLNESKTRLADLKAASPDDIRKHDRPVVAFGEEMLAHVNELRRFLYSRMYTHFTVNRIRLKVERVICDLFDAFMDHPELMPDKWQIKLADPLDDIARARIVCDYIAGMTDRYAMKEHAKLFDIGMEMRL